MSNTLDEHQRFAAFTAKHGPERGTLITTDNLPPEWDLEPGDTFASKAKDGVRLRFHVLRADRALRIADVHIAEEAVT